MVVFVVGNRNANLESDGRQIRGEVDKKPRVEFGGASGLECGTRDIQKILRGTFALERSEIQDRRLGRGLVSSANEFEREIELGRIIGETLAADI